MTADRQTLYLYVYDIINIVLDIYPKIDENYRVQTTGGAVCKSYLLHLPISSSMDRFLTLHHLSSSMDGCFYHASPIVSIFGWILITFLVVFEINSYMTPKFKEHMVVDTSLGQQLRININVTFHALTCAEVSYTATIRI